MKIKLAAILALSLFPALALAHPTDASMHTHGQLPEHSSRMHTHNASTRRA